MCICSVKAGELAVERVAWTEVPRVCAIEARILVEPHQKNYLWLGGSGTATVQERQDSSGVQEDPTVRVRDTGHGREIRGARRAFPNASLFEDPFGDGWPVPRTKDGALAVQGFQQSWPQWAELFLVSSRWDRRRPQRAPTASLVQVFRDCMGPMIHSTWRRWGVSLGKFSWRTTLPTQPDYSAANCITGPSYLESAGVASSLRTNVARKMRDVAELKQELSKV